jgi:orotidine-5'-phosphate decarboxylase
MTSFNERMLLSSKKKESRLVLALDIFGPFEERLKRAERILELTGHMVAAVKLNHHLLLPYGLRGLESIIKKCRRDGLPLIADLKLNDIESTNLNAVESLIHYGFDAVIANPFVGYEEGLGKVIERVHAGGCGILFLVYMSHGGAREGYSLLTEEVEPLYRLFARRSRTWGADGVIVSAKSSERITEVRDIVGKDCLIFSPGVGPQGGAASTGISSGADFIIAGRVVTEAREPAKAIYQMMK